MTLPQSTFADLALDLFAVACEQARGLAALQANSLALSRAGQEAGCDPESRDRVWQIFESSLIEAKRTAKASDAAHQLIKALVPYEAHIRELLRRQEKAA